jgi:ferredoxin/coenzyme F420-reducing hydrogenase delta subunit
MTWLQFPLRRGFLWLEGLLDRIFGPAWNPLYHLGALGFFYYWIVAVSGIYVYVFFDTGTSAAYGSVEYLTRDQWYLGGVMRSLHRYASDGMMLMMGVHMLREFSLDRYRGKRWFTWVTGMPILWLVFACGITGYWMVWDKLAQYVALATTEWLDTLPIFGEPVARNFLAPTTLDDRFFTLLTFMHIAVPLILLFVLWIHLQRVSRPKINPARGLAVGTMAMMVVLSFAHPAVSQGPADLARVPAVVGLDWFYLPAYPLLDIWSGASLWAFVGTLSLLVAALPWLPPMRRVAVAKVDLDNCNGCKRCADDCPFGAVIMQPRTDGQPFEHEAVVDPAICVSCGICAGACPTSTPFRRASELIPGIDLPQRPLRVLRQELEAAVAGLQGKTRIVIFTCDPGGDLAMLRTDSRAAVGVPCIAALPPSFLDYALSRNLVDGIFITGCREDACFHRFGIRWMEDRLARKRDPYLRARVPRERIRVFWGGGADRRALLRELDGFAASLASLPAAATTSLPPAAVPLETTPGNGTHA